MKVKTFLKKLKPSRQLNDIGSIIIVYSNSWFDENIVIDNGTNEFLSKCRNKEYINEIWYNKKINTIDIYLNCSGKLTIYIIASR